jgi:hypothetical protein
VAGGGGFGVVGGTGVGWGVGVTTIRLLARSVRVAFVRAETRVAPAGIITITEPVRSLTVWLRFVFFFVPNV